MMSVTCRSSLGVARLVRSPATMTVMPTKKRRVWKAVAVRRTVAVIRRMTTPAWVSMQV